jgi:hypothetical protein
VSASASFVCRHPGDRLSRSIEAAQRHIERADVEHRLLQARSLERGVVLRQGVLRQRSVERRDAGIQQLRIHIHARSARGKPANFVANPVDHHLSQIGLQGPVAAILKAIQMPQRGDHGFLHEIGRVRDVASPSRQPAGGPAGEDRQMTREQLIESVLIPSTCAIEQIAGAVGGIGRLNAGMGHADVRAIIRRLQCVRFPLWACSSAPAAMVSGPTRPTATGRTST